MTTADSIDLLERRWLAAQAAYANALAECELLRQSIELGEAAYRRSQAKLRELDALRNALREAIAGFEFMDDRMPIVPRRSSAA